VIAGFIKTIRQVATAVKLALVICVAMLVAAGVIVELIGGARAIVNLSSYVLALIFGSG
jgi:hypothetical protein